MGFHSQNSDAVQYIAMREGFGTRIFRNPESSHQLTAGLIWIHLATFVLKWSDISLSFVFATITGRLMKYGSAITTLGDRVQRDSQVQSRQKHAMPRVKLSKRRGYGNENAISVH